jgi:hypothetical protein
MRPKPCDLESMIEAARAETATYDAVARAVGALRRPPARAGVVTVPRVAIVAASVTALMALPLFTPKSSGAWAQVAAETAKQTRYRERTYVRVSGQSVVEIERWTDGKRFLHRSKTRSKFPSMGSDGKRYFQIFPASKYATIEKLPNFPTEPYLSGLGSVPSLSVDDLIRDEKVRPLGDAKEVATPEGKRLLYEVEFLADPERGDMTVTSTGKFYTMPGDSRIRRWEFFSKAGSWSYAGDLEYPEHIPDETFAFAPPPGIKVYDLDQGRALLRKTIEKGYGTKSVEGHSVTLRAVVAGTNGDLNVLWTGAPPNGDLQPPIKLHGIPTIRTYGLSIMTTKVYEYIPPVEKLDYLPTFLGGMSVQVKKDALPDRVTLTVPVFAPDPKRPVYDFEGHKKGLRSRFVGNVIYRDVPVLKPGPFYSFLDDLGLREPTRYEALVRDYKKKPKP